MGYNIAGETAILKKDCQIKNDMWLTRTNWCEMIEKRDAGWGVCVDIYNELGVLWPALEETN